jgi:tetratricopeptide (TPR) repeat protein
MTIFQSIWTLFLAVSLGWAPVSGAVEADHKERSVSVVERKRVQNQKGAKSGKREPSFDQSQIYASKIEEKLIANIKKTIAILEKTGERLPRKSAQRADVLEKVLNLSLEQAAYLSSQESRRYDQEFEAWERGGSRGAAPKLDSSQSLGHWNKVAGIASRILEEYPKGKSADIVAFNYALALQFLNREQESAKAFSQLIQKYPNSPVSGDAYCSLGDYYFDKLDFRNALNNYGSALKFRKSSRYSFALFKSGWSYFNLGQYRQALESWKKTVTYARINPSKSNSALKDETLRDMVYAFAELGDVDPAIAYFNANGGQEFVGQFLKLLANTYSDQGKYAKAMDAYRRLQKAAPLSSESPDAQVEIISLAYELGQMKTVWTELERFPQMFSESSQWASKNGRKKVLEVQITIRDQILYYAKISHKKAQQSDNPSQFAQARYGYELFLKSFPKSKEVVEVKFNLADILFFEKKYREAGKVYLELALMGADKAVIYNEKGAPAENVHKKSAEYMLDAFSKDFDPELKALLKEVPSPTKPATPISLRAQNFLKACGTYMKMYPEDKKTIKNCEVYTAEIYYRTNNRKKALPFLWLVANKYSAEPEGKAAVENIIPLYKDDKKGLLIAAKKLSANPNYQKGELGVKLGELLQGAEVETVAAEKDALKRGEGWMKQAEKYKTRKDAPKYLFNASVDFLKAGEVDKAIVAY